MTGYWRKIAPVSNKVLNVLTFAASNNCICYISKFRKINFMKRVVHLDDLAHTKALSTHI